ncbi:hypothetical protein CRUP_003034 [Coryphaenoides rupestris]|nr:hypothetical protein CRUP_003034 [Coryphaenoides rupestris]
MVVASHFLQQSVTTATASLHGVLKAFPKVKRSRAQEEKDAPPLKRGSSGDAVSGDIFIGVTAYILPAGIGNARCQIFQKQIHQNGGKTENALGSTVTHVVVDDNMARDRALRLLKMDRLPPTVDVVKCSWLSACIAAKRLLDADCYRLLLCDGKLNEPQGKVTEELPNVSHANPNTVEPALDSREQEETEETTQKSRGDANDEEEGVSQNHLEALITGQHPKGETPSSTVDPAPQTSEPKLVSSKWVCAQSSESKNNNFNKHITDKLEMLAKAYTHKGDKWRALGYSKAVNALKSYHKPITGIGKRMADKIDEIMESGHLRKLDNIGEAVPVLELFTNIWGAGAKTAQLWYQQGFRTLEDIRTKANLSNTQKIGLKHYDDLLDRMPREEAGAIEKLVREATLAIDPNLLAMACGSYRRGKATCGDVDVLITHPDGKSHRGVFSKVLQSLRQSGFLTDDLVSHEENGQQKKYMGVCRLPGPVSRRHRRLDIIVVPYGEFACAIMYFTGSAHFNRSLRALAKTKSMSLSEHSLNEAVLRHGSAKVHAGTPLATATERDVFSLLGVPFREPRERDW